MHRHVAVRRLQIVALLILSLSVVDAPSHRAAAQTPPTKELVISLGMKSTVISAGEFLMA